MTSLSKIMMAATATALGFAGTALAQQKEVMIGAQCDRTGPTQIVGVVICPAQQDYIEPDQLEGRHRGLQDQLQRARQRIQGAAGGRGI